MSKPPQISIPSRKRARSPTQEERSRRMHPYAHRADSSNYNWSHSHLSLSSHAPRRRSLQPNTSGQTVEIPSQLSMRGAPFAPTSDPHAYDPLRPHTTSTSRGQGVLQHNGPYSETTGFPSSFHQEDRESRAVTAVRALDEWSSNRVSQEDAGTDGHDEDADFPLFENPIQGREEYRQSSSQLSHNYNISPRSGGRGRGPITTTLSRDAKRVEGNQQQRTNSFGGSYTSPRASADGYFSSSHSSPRPSTTSMERDDLEEDNVFETALPRSRRAETITYRGIILTTPSSPEMTSTFSHTTSRDSNAMAYSSSSPDLITDSPPMSTAGSSSTVMTPEMGTLRYPSPLATSDTSLGASTSRSSTRGHYAPGQRYISNDPQIVSPIVPTLPSWQGQQHHQQLTSTPSSRDWHHPGYEVQVPAYHDEIPKYTRTKPSYSSYDGSLGY